MEHQGITARALRCLALALGPALLLAAPAEAFTVPQGVPAGDRVLLVGIDQYQDSELSLPPNSSTKDSQDIRRLVTEGMGIRPDHVLMLLNADASRANILRAFDEWLVAGSSPGARVVFQYSGHGAQWKDSNGDETDGKDEVLVPWDTRVVRGNTQNLIIDDEIESRLSRLADRDVLVIVDACHSGTISRDLALTDLPDETGGGRERLARKVLQADVDDGAVAGASRGMTRGGDAELSARAQESSFVARDGTARIWTAVSPTEVALVDAQSRPEQGVFTRRLVEGVLGGRADANRNGVISNAEVLNYVRSASDAYCRADPSCGRKGRSLTPTLETATAWLGRDFRTGRAAGAVAEAVADTLGQGPAGSASTTPGPQAGPPGPLRLGIYPGDTVRLGKEVVFEVTSPIAGHLVVLDINAAGEAAQIFPNNFSKASGNRIAAGRALRLPEPSYGFAFEAQPPMGKGTLVAVVTSQAVDLTDLFPPTRGFGAVERPAILIGEVVQRVAKALENRLSNQGVQWSYATREYTISP